MEQSERLKLSPAEIVSVSSLFLALVVGAVVAVRHGWLPISDEALIELRVRDVPSELPLVGVYSRFGWSHPGPALFYVLAPFYWLGRSASTALIVGALCIHFAFGIFAWLSTRAVNKVGGLVVLVGVAAVLATTSPTSLRTPWNPYVVLVGGFAVVCLGWSMAERRRLGSLLLFATATFLIQSHLVTAPMVLAVVLASGALALVPMPGRERMPWKWLGGGAALATLMWLPPLIQQFWGGEGNLAALINRGGEGQSAGLAEGIGVLSRAFALRPSILNLGELSNVFVNTDLAVPVWLLLPAAGVVLAIRRRDWTHIRGFVICFAGLLGTWAALAATTNGLFNYLVLGVRPIAMITICVGVSSILVSIDAVREPAKMWALAACVVALSGAIAVQQWGAANPFESYAPTIRAIERATLKAAEGRSTEVVSAADINSSEVAAALLLQLERRGVDARGPEFGSAKVGKRRAGSGTEYQVIVAPIGMKRSLAKAGWEILDVYQPIGARDRARIRKLIDERTKIAEEPADSTTKSEVESELQRTADEIERIDRGRISLLVAGRTSGED